MGDDAAILHIQAVRLNYVGTDPVIFYWLTAPPDRREGHAERNVALVPDL
jgi:hypothetical protein